MAISLWLESESCMLAGDDRYHKFYKTCFVYSWMFASIWVVQTKIRKCIYVVYLMDFFSNS